MLLFFLVVVVDYICIFLLIWPYLSNSIERKFICGLCCCSFPTLFAFSSVCCCFVPIIDDLIYGLSFVKLTPNCNIIPTLNHSFKCSFRCYTRLLLPSYHLNHPWFKLIYQCKSVGVEYLWLLVGLLEI